MTVLAFAPFGWYPLGMLALALWYQGLRGGEDGAAFGLGWLYGLGLFGVGVFWIRISLNEFAQLPILAAHGLMMLFVTVMALYYGLAGWLIAKLGRPLWRAHQDWVVAVLLLPAIWVLMEWLRAWLFTGFPWLLLGNTQIDAPLAGWVPVLGVHGLSLLAALSAGLLWLAATHLRRYVLAIVLLLGLWGGGALFFRIDWTQPQGKPFDVALVQANIAPALKWQPEALEPNLQAHLQLTREQLGRALIVWPETAIPSFLHEVRRPLIEPLVAQARAAGSDIVIGVPIMEANGHYYNGLLSLGSHEDRYDKRHLVPFGEYLPLRDWIEPLVNWFEVPMSSFTPGTAQRPLLQVGQHPVGVSICYEDVFPEHVRQALPEAHYLLNVTNDAWFGKSLAPAQHLEFARLRALENGRYLVRATNTGISAIIDQRGRVQARSPLFERAVLVGQVQPFSGQTPFARLGSGVALGLAWIMLGLGLWRRQAAMGMMPQPDAR